jgi:hypothetical protein
MIKQLPFSATRGLYYKTFYVRNKLVLVPGKPLRPSLVFVGKVRSLP